MSSQAALGKRRAPGLRPPPPARSSDFIAASGEETNKSLAFKLRGLEFDAFSLLLRLAGCHGDGLSHGHESRTESRNQNSRWTHERDSWHLLPAHPPEKSEPSIVIQEAWGVNHHIEEVCRRFRQRRLLAIAPELFHGEGPGVVFPYGDFAEDHAGLFEAHNAGIRTDIGATIEYLGDSPEDRIPSDRRHRLLRGRARHDDFGDVASDRNGDFILRRRPGLLAAGNGALSGDSGFLRRSNARC